MTLFDAYPKPDSATHGRALLPDCIRKKTFSWDTIPRHLAIWKNGPFSDEEMRKLASLDVLQINPNCYQGSEFAQAIKQIDPATMILGYRNVIIDHATFEGELFQQHPDWYLKDRETGEYVTMGTSGGCARKPLFDLRIPEVRQWWVNDIKRQCRMPGLDGVLIDALAKVLTNWEPKTRATGSSDDDLLAYSGLVYEMLLENIRANADEGLIVANALRSGYVDCLKSYADVFFHGSYLEWVEQPCPDLYEDHLARTIDSCIQIGIEGGKFLCFNPHADHPPPRRQGAAKSQVPAERTIMPAMVDAVNVAARSEEETIRRMREAFAYKLAIYLICACEYAYFSYACSHCANHDRRLWFPEYPEFDRPLGKPLGPAEKHGPYAYSRRFEHVFVELNLELRECRIEWE